MRLSRASALLLVPLSLGAFGACATAEDGGPAMSSDAGAGSTGGASGGGGAPSTTAGAGGKAAAAGATGFAGAGATAGRAAGGGGGAGGTTGSAGKGGTSGAGGVVGNGGGGGGAPPVFQPGECALDPTISLQYLQGSNNQKQITAQFQFSNSSDTPAPLGSMRIRYFFTNEETSAWKTAVYNAQLDGGTGGYRKVDGTTLTIVKLAQAEDGADSYVEFTFPAGFSLEKGATAKVNWDMQPTSYDRPDQVQSNDYSYNAADTTFTVWDHVAVYVGDTLAWGCAPKSAGAGGSAGDSGSSDAGAPGSAGATP